MKRSLLKVAAIVACLGMTAVSLSGCLSVFPLGRSYDYHDDSYENQYDDQYDESYDNKYDDAESYDALDEPISGIIGSSITKTIMRSIPDMGEVLENRNRSDDHRETVEYQGNQEQTVVLNAQSATQIILSQNGDSDSDNYKFEYDPSVFEVTATPDGDSLSITVTMLKKSPTDGNGEYKCYLTLPSRAYQEIKADLNHTGLAISGMSSPFTAKSTESGLVLYDCKGDISIDEAQGAMAADIPADYTGSFRYHNDSGAFVVRFPNGEPENFNFNMESKDSIVIKPEEWGGDIETSFSYQKGTGGASFDCYIGSGAAVIGEQ